MKKTISIVLCILLLLIAFTGCQSNLTTDTAQEDSTENSNVIEADFSSTDADMFTSHDEDASYDESSAVKIELAKVRQNQAAVRLKYLIRQLHLRRKLHI